MKKKATFAYARLNARIMPFARGERYEDPLADVLAARGFGEVTASGTLQSATGEVEYCGLDLELLELEQSIPFVCEFLTERGAPRGSQLEYQLEGKDVVRPFGLAEGLALYLNGTDLPREVYERSDVNEVYREVARLVADGAAIEGNWRGPTETAFYLYGRSFDEMRNQISAYLSETPLCERARVVRIA